MSQLTKNYVEIVKAVLDSVPHDKLDALVEAVLGAPMVLTCGNGGSAATAIHFASDLRSLGIPAFDMLSPAKTTQIMNDVSADGVFVCQMVPNSLTVAFSASGISPDIVRLLDDRRAKVVLVTSTMKLGRRPWDTTRLDNKLIIEIDSDDYEVIEDAHLCLCHAAKKELRARMQ